jgi:uncharacterized protein YggE
MLRLRKHHFALVVAPLLIGAVAADTPASLYTQLSVTGTGFAEQATEYVAVRAQTESFSTSPSRAVSDDARKMARLQNTLKRIGVAEEDFRTADFRFAKGHDPEDHDIPGYNVQHGLSVVVRDTDNVGPALDAMVEAGADGLSLERSYGYGRDTDPASLRRARAAAIRDAQAKAADYASALRLRIRRVVTIADGGGYVTDGPMPVARAVAADVSTQIESRPAAVRASVNVVFELEK